MTQQLYTRPVSRRARKRTKPFIHRLIPRWHGRYFLAAGWGVAILSLLFNAGSHLRAADSQDSCQQVVQSAAVLSRAQLTKILSIPERSDQQSVRDIVAEPYCQLPDLELRDGVTAKREAYPLAFSPSTWIVMLYEGDEYAGFAFSFQ